MTYYPLFGELPDPPFFSQVTLDQRLMARIHEDLVEEGELSSITAEQIAQRYRVPPAVAAMVMDELRDEAVREARMLAHARAAYFRSL